MSETCFVLFRSGECNLEKAIKHLRSDGLTVLEKPDHLVVSRPAAPSFRVYLQSGATVKTESEEIAANYGGSPGLRECDARFEIAITDLDEALDEINTLMEIQGALQVASAGVLFLPWNGELLEHP